MSKPVIIRFFEGLENYSLIAKKGKALLWANEIHLDSGLKNDPVELEKTIEHELRHFSLKEQNNSMLLFLLKSFWMDFCENWRVQAYVVCLIVSIGVLVFWRGGI